jgi:hypothetical protein
MEDRSGRQVALAFAAFAFAALVAPRALYLPGGGARSPEGGEPRLEIARTQVP